MIDFDSRHVIEALRSGIPSREVGRCFSSARPQLLERIGATLRRVEDERLSGGMIVSGKYGEGKTHLLNTVFDMAQSQNMVVSMVSLSKETPFNMPWLAYAKLMQNTYLPGRLQPGVTHVFEALTQGHPMAASMAEYALKDTASNKLYYLLKSYLGTDDMEEKYMLLADFEGDFIANATLKQIYRRIYAERVTYNENFTKTRHMGDYFAFMSRLFRGLGYAGWVLLFDEAELIGRLGKRARLNAYKHMADFMLPLKDAPMDAVYSFFAFNASFVPDVIDSKHEYENLDAAQFDAATRERITAVLDAIVAAPQLNPLNDAELMEIIGKIRDFHAQAYGWEPRIEPHTLFSATEKRGYLLRTRIRAAVEQLDQLYQYADQGSITVGALGQVDLGEELPSLDALMDEG